MVYYWSKLPILYTFAQIAWKDIIVMKDWKMLVPLDAKRHKQLTSVHRPYPTLR